jgi:hypothetical protein
MSSIPERLWRVVRGHWDLAQDREEEAQALADAYAELAVQLRAAEKLQAAAQAGTGTLPPARRLPSGSQDPYAVSYELLGVTPGINLEALDEAYRARLAELPLDRFPEGSPQRQATAARRQAIEAAYEKLRDVLNPTETRFERIEF